MWPSPAVTRGKQCTHFTGSFGWDFQHVIPSGLLVPGVHPSGSLFVSFIRLERAGGAACGWAEQRELQLRLCVCTVRGIYSFHQPNSSLQLAPVRLRARIRTTVLLIRGESLDCNVYDHCKLFDTVGNSRFYKLAHNWTDFFLEHYTASWNPNLCALHITEILKRIRKFTSGCKLNSVVLPVYRDDSIDSVELYLGKQTFLQTGEYFIYMHKS